ncbi:hypothetical protein WJN01_07800 [Flavobacteriaceae bacterium SZ-1-7]|uniref:hypothetical protein n=1 Tax=Tamlana sedimenti TaxID=3134126 RepID=UPI00312A933B
MEKIKFKIPQTAENLDEFVLNLDKGRTVDKAFLSNVTYTKKTKYLKYIILGFLIMLLTASLGKLMDYVVENALDRIPFSKRLLVLIIFIYIAYLLYLFIKNQKPKSDVVFLSGNEIFVLKHKSQIHTKKTFIEAFKFSIDEVKSIKEYPSNFLKSRFLLNLEKGERIFFEQNNFWNKNFFVAKSGMKQSSFFDALKKFAPKYTGANEFAKVILTALLIVEVILPYIAILALASIESSIYDSINYSS